MFRHKSTNRYHALSCCTLRFAFEFASGAVEPSTLPEHLRPDPFGEVVQADRTPGLAPAKGILLEGARTAFVSCHLIVKIPRQGAYRLPVIPLAASSGLQAELYREFYHYLPKTGKYYPDALVPVAEAVQSKLPEPDNRIDARTAQGYWLDVWIEGNGRKKRITDWTLFDHRYGPLLDGTAFAKTHRGSRPIQLVYLPIKPEWPASYLWWGEPGYEREFVNVVPTMERHFREKGWTNTRFEMFFNHKKRYKDGDMPYLRDAPRPWIWGTDGFVHWLATAPLASIRLKPQRNAVRDVTLLNEFRETQPIKRLRAEAARRFNGTELRDWYSPRPAYAGKDPWRAGYVARVRRQDFRAGAGVQQPG